MSRPWLDSSATSQLRTVTCTLKLLSSAISACPPSASLCGSLKALRTPLAHRNDLTNLDVEAWQSTLNELHNFADDVVALLKKYRHRDDESEQRLKELHASAVNHELDLDARGFLTAFHPSHAHAAQICKLSSLANTPPICLKQVFHSFPTLLTCVQTLIAIRATSNSIENAVRTALKATASRDEFPCAGVVVPNTDDSRYSYLYDSLQTYLRQLEPLEKTDSNARRITLFLHILMDPGALQDERLKLYPTLQPFQLPAEVGRSLTTTVYKANTSVYDGDKHLWITKVAVKAYTVDESTENLFHSFHREALRLRTLSHPCLPAFYGYHWPSFDTHPMTCSSDFDNRPCPKVLLATELMTKNLFQARSLPALRSRITRLRVLRDIADAIAYLHSQNCYYGRLNPRNVLLRMSKKTVYGRVKLDVTSLAGRVLSPDLVDHNPVSSVLFIPPESLQPGPMYFTGDVWSLGIVGCFLMMDQENTCFTASASVFSRMASGQGFDEQIREWCTSISDEKVRSIIDRCLQRDPEKRSDSRAIHRYLNEFLCEVSGEESPSKIDTTEELVDGIIVDEVIDSSTVDKDPAVQEPDSKNIRSPSRSPARFECLESSLRGHATRTEMEATQNFPDRTEEASHVPRSKPILSSPSPALASFNRALNPRVLIPQLIESDSESNEADNPAHQFVLAQNLETGCGVDRDIRRAIELYRAAHASGYTRATLRLGQCYLGGSGVPKCNTTAVHLLGEAANQGHPMAMVELGRLHETGKGVKESPSKSAGWFRQAAECGFAEGLRCYGNCLMAGFGVQEDVLQGVKLITEAHNQGSIVASYELALCYRDGVGAGKNVTQAYELFRGAAERGHADAKMELANCLYEGVGTTKDWNLAFQMYKQSADQGTIEAFRYLGECYEEGHGVERDLKKAIECFTTASKDGNASAMSSLASCYERGDGVDRDMKKAIQLYKRAEKKNDYLALNNLGVLFERGVHVKRDYEKAVKYYKKALDQGFSEAACNLADCYLAGHGVRKDVKKAIELYREAAEEGHVGAKCELGSFYYRGVGVPKDYDKAVSLFKQACSREPEALRLLGVAHLAGNGVGQNIDEGVKLFKRAAELGNSEANLNLGLCSMTGCGMSRCFAETLSLLEVAAEGGNLQAKLILGNMYYEGRGVQRDIRKAVEFFLGGECVDLDMM